ncbi:hypothetical protein HK102_000761 [Quaeritorhiza haematococci]|nr:hypothetical protein HK102_000761 [Quaeritorhiza haematococci]
MAFAMLGLFATSAMPISEANDEVGPLESSSKLEKRAAQQQTGGIDWKMILANTRHNFYKTYANMHFGAKATLPISKMSSSTIVEEISEQVQHDQVASIPQEQLISYPASATGFSPKLVGTYYSPDRFIASDRQLKVGSATFHWKVNGPFPMNLLPIRTDVSVLGHDPDFQDYIVLHVGSTIFSPENFQILCRKTSMDPAKYRQLRAEIEALPRVKELRRQKKLGSWVAIWHDGKERERYRTLEEEGLLEIIERKGS